jgi:hypothetical protein
MKQCEKKYCRTGQVSDDNMVQAHGILDTLRIYDTYCFIHINNVTRMRLDVYCLSCLNITAGGILYHPLRFQGFVHD